MKKLLRLFMLAVLFLPLALNAQCDAIAAFPWTEDFEAMTASTVPTCWDNSASTSSTLTSNPDRIWGVYSYGGNKMIRMYNYYVQSGTALINTPTFTLPAGVSYDLTFNYSHRASCGAFTVKISTDEGSTFSDLQSYTSTGSNNYTDPGEFTEATISLAAYAGQSIILQFFSTANYGSGAIFVDDLRIGTPATCFKVTDLAIDATATTSNSLTLTWTDALNTGATYEIYDMSDTTPIMTGTSDLTYTVTGLVANTAYTFGIQTNCGGGDIAAGYATISGRTACAAISSLNLPYTEGFESVPSGSNQMPFCWTRPNTGNYPNSSTSYPHSGSRTLYFYSTTSGVDSMIAVTPQFDETIDLSTLRLRFFARGGYSSGGTLIVGTMSDPNDIATFDSLTQFAIPSGTYANEDPYTFANFPTTDNQYIAFLVKKGSATQYVYLDDLTIDEIPNCPDVTGVSLDSVMVTTAYISWDESEAPDFDVEVRQNGTPIDAIVDIIDNTAEISGLEIDNDYQVYVRANCGNEFSPWSNAVNVHIGYCLPNPTTRDGQGITSISFGGMTNTTHPSAAPFYGNYADSIGNIPAGTTANVTITYATGTSTVYSYGTLIWVDWDNSLSFDEDELVYTGMSAQGSGGVPQILEATFDIPATQEEGTYRMRIAGADSYFDTYINTGSGNHSPCFTSNYAVAEDYTLNVTEAPACLPVTNLTASDITAHTATLTWEGNASYYVIVNMANGDVVESNVSETSQELTGLNPETSYTFGVIASCNESDTFNVSFTTTISCFAPSNVAVALTPGDGSVATVSWTDTLGAAWQICLNGDTTDLIDVYETSYSFDNLTPEQPYTVMVRTNCSADGEGFSTWTNAVTFTPTDAYSITVNEGTTTNDYVPIYGLYVDNITKSQFIIPATDLTAMQFGNINKLTFYSSTVDAPWANASFNVYLTETNETTVESLADYDEMTLVYTGSLSIVNNKMEVNFTTPFTYMGGNLMIGFLQTVSGSYKGCSWYGVTANGASQGGYVNSYGTYISQRNFLPKTTINYTPGEEPDCLPVNGLAVVDSTITTEGATLTWNGDADSYNVYVINGTDTTFEQNVSETTATLTGLTAMTSYTYGVRAVCGTNESDIRTVSFATACAAVELPYTETFETSSNTVNCWTTEGNGNWTIGTGDYSTSTGAFEGSKNAKITHSTTGDATKFISPVLDGVEEGLTLNFAYVLRSWAGDVDELRVYSRADAESAWQQVAEYTNAAATWTVENVIIPGTVYQIAFEYTDNYGYGLGIDSVTFTAMTSDFCFAPTGLTVSDITTEGATLTWNGDADSYNVYVINGTDTTLAEQNVSENTLALTGLTAMTSYTYGVRSVCPNDESEMVIVTFTTACTAVAIPYTESFEATSTTLGCWSVANIDANTGITTSNPYSGNNAFRFAYNTNPPQYLISPELSGTEDGLQVSFMYRIESTSFPESFQLGYSTTTNEISAFTWGVEQTNLMNTTYEEYSEFLPAGVKYVCIKYTANDKFYLYIDDVTFAIPPTCLPVTDLTVDAISETSATISWTGNAASYDVYKNGEFVTDVTTTTYTFNSLTASTDYTFGVQAICSATDSASMVTVEVTTSCPDVTTLPYNEGFENGLGCWTTINASTDGQPWTVNNCSGLSVNPHNGAYVASSWSWSSSAMHANAWLISPKFVLPNATDSLSFSWWEITNPNYHDSYSVVLSTTTNDTAAFTTVLRPYDTAAGTWTMHTVDLTPYAGQSVYIAFHHVDYNENYLLIDDIALYQGAYIPPAPDSLTVVFAVNDATMGTTVPAPGAYQYLMGDTVSFHPEANPGYHFTNWVMSAGGQSDTLSANYVSVYFIVNGAMMSYGTVTMTALFEADSTPATTYTVTLATADATMGSVSPAGANTVNAGASFTATATANEGYNFVAWMSNNDLVSVDNPYTFTVTEDITLTAVFEADSTPVVTTYTVTLSTADATMGTVNLPGENTVVANNQFTAQATANEGYHFVAWTSNNATVSTANPYTFTVTADIALTATFEADSTPVVVCNTPTGLHYTAIENHAIAIAWDADANVNSWNIRYRMSGNGAWNNATSNTNSYTISGLQGLTSYDIEVQANCGDGNVSEWCDAITVQTTNVGIVNHLENSVVLFPNPAREYVDIRIDGEFNVSSMEVYDVYGKLINNINVVDNPTRIYVSNLSNGMYFVRVTTDAGVVTKTFVKK